MSRLPYASAGRGLDRWPSWPGRDISPNVGRKSVVAQVVTTSPGEPRVEQPPCQERTPQRNPLISLTVTQSAPHTPLREEGINCDMKCVFCHAKVAGSPERCPECGYDLGGRVPRQKGAQSRVGLHSNRFRIALIGLMAAAVLVGILARMPGTDDTSGNAARRLARNHAQYGFEALGSGSFAEAREQLDLALRVDNMFAEAFLGRSMALLALGAYEESGMDARRARALFEDDRVDSRAWLETQLQHPKASGLQYSNRLDCLAAAAQRDALPVTRAPQLYTFMRELDQSASCDEAAAIQARWLPQQRLYGVMARALTLCPTSWPCQR